MQAAQPRHNESRALDALRALDVLDTVAEPVLDALARAASLACGTPIALISLIDEHRQWFKANIGLDGVQETPRELAFCAHAVLDEAVMVVPDASADARFADNPLVTGAPDIRFYAGAPLRLEGGETIGTLCVIDQQPHQPDAKQLEMLRCLATAVVAALETRVARQRIEAAVRETAWAALVMQHSADAIISLDADLVIRRWNPAAEKLFGYSAAEVIGRSASLLAPPDQLGGQQKARNRVVAGQAHTYDAVRRHKDGTDIPVSITLVPEFDAQGQVPNATLFVRDTRHHQDQLAASAAAAEMMRRHYEHTPLMLHVIDGSNRLLMVSDRWLQALGYSREEVIGRPSLDFLTPASREKAMQSGLPVVRQLGRIDDIELQFVTRSGQVRDVLLSAIADIGPEPWPDLIVAGLQDVTERKLQEAARRESEDLLERTGQVAGVGGWSLDVASGHVRWTDEIRRIHGVPLDYQPQLDTAINFYAPEARPIIQTAVEAGLANGTPWDLELPMLRADGSRIWVRAVGAVEFVDDKPSRLVGALQDISERRRLDDQLAAKRRALARSNEDLERFAYVASHDLQEPLRMVTSYGQLLERRHAAELSEEGREFLHYMVDGGQRAQSLIRDLLALARLDSEGRAPVPVALEQVLDDVLQPLRLKLQETGAKVTHDALPTVDADPAQMRQLLGNLIGNALKFTGSRPAVVHVGALRERGKWRISVRDNGIGIEAKYFDRIFVMFQRLHLRTEHDGTGIGLALCKKIVDRHGGEIGVESVPGEGATFWFTLPDATPNREG